jgi:hypothetical protein
VAPLNIVELRETLRYKAGLSRMRGELKTKAKNILSREGKKCEFETSQKKINMYKEAKLKFWTYQQFKDIE